MVALGSNLGDRESHLEYAVARLRVLLDHLRVSAFVETEPVDVPPQPDFLNAVAIGLSDAEPHAILERLRAIEQARARRRPFSGAPRTLDLDLILVGNEIIESAALILPHPRFRARRFVLEPLCEIAPETRDPVTALSARELLQRL